ncbi:hypothetical protein BDU57DRAFT_586584 [Ampelomyces quisqualis]|uniref:Ubiquitin-like domain-containing protein n=1 Tax=Ampelomyces quisqualis TaxID=50730 RepID=A0A6A5QRM5_AMPQU|nr:hypothetical protein BDU57DRAFT_586584 [Ampelomyces quisqualis]
MRLRKMIETEQAPLHCELRSNTITSFLLPDLGEFPWKAVSEFQDTLPAAMVANAGVFLPMYQSEAMWIAFNTSSYRDYMIKIYVDGVNTISGEHALEDADTRLRRQANSFVAMPFASSHSIESQVTGSDAAGGIQLEITPHKESCNIYRDALLPWKPCNHPEGNRAIIVKSIAGRTLTLHTCEHEMIKILQECITDELGLFPGIQRLIFARRLLDDCRSISDYNIKNGSIIHFLPRLQSYDGVPPKPAVHEMSIAADSKIHQVIEENTLSDGRTTVINAQILNSATYKAVTSEDPPDKPISVATYAKHGLPFYKKYEEPSGISADFCAGKSVAEVETIKEETAVPRTVTLRSRQITNPNGPLRAFRTVRNLKDKLGGNHVASCWETWRAGRIWGVELQGGLGRRDETAYGGYATGMT